MSCTMEIWYDGPICHIGEYCIAGNVDDGYTVFKEPYDENDDPETLYGDEDTDFESAVVWCLNS